MSRLFPILKNVLVLLDARQEITAGGLFIPASVQKPELWGMAVGIGNQVQHIAEGDRVLTQAHMGYRYTVNGRDYLVIAEKNILAIDRKAA